MKRALFLLVLSSALSLYLVGLPGVVYVPLFIVGGALLLWLFEPGILPAPRPEHCLLFASVCLTLAAVDVGLRFVLDAEIYYRPHERFANRWPADRDLARYDRNVYPTCHQRCRPLPCSFGP